MSSDCVLVTGASGFIAKHCIAELLRSGYAVRGTVRSLARQGEIEHALRQAGIAAPHIELVEADLTSDEGWAEAVQGCRFVLHVASPFPANEPRHPDDLIKPARDGAVRVLNAAATAGVERVIQTSSVVAILRCDKPDDQVRTEADWTDLRISDLSTYARSKTLAERAAWDEMQRLAATSPMTLSTVNPGIVLGPALDAELSTSHVLLRLLGRGVYPALPKLAYPVVDVRDVARQHVVAMTHPNAPGQRWLSCNGTLSLRRIGQLIVETLPDLRRKVPTIEMPSTLIRLASHIDSNLASIRADLGKANLCDNSHAIDQLDFEFRAPEEAVRTAVLSLRELGII